MGDSGIFMAKPVHFHYSDEFRLFRIMRMFVLENVDMVSFHGVTSTSSLRGRSMSTSLLYHRFGLVGYRQVREIFEPGITTFRIEQPRERLRCSHCHSEEVWAQGGVERTFRGLPIGKQP